MKFFNKNDFENTGSTDEPVCVFETDKTYEADILRGMLEDSGIDAFIITAGRERDILFPITKIFKPEPGKHYKIYVKSDDREKALDILNAEHEEEN